jgi:predicted phage tail protein
MQHTTILLSGSLAQRFGRKHIRMLDTGSTREAFSAIKNTLQGFTDFINQQAKLGLRYAIFRNGENVGESEFALSGTRELRIVPVIEGSKRGGVLQTILGVVLIVVGVFTSPYDAGATLSVGIGMTAGGVIQMLSPQMKGLRSREAAENAPSYAFGGPVNTTAAGNIVGILYGKRRIGGAIISAGIYAEDLAIPGTALPPGGGEEEL